MKKETKLMLQSLSLRERTELTRALSIADYLGVAMRKHKITKADIADKKIPMATINRLLNGTHAYDIMTVTHINVVLQELITIIDLMPVKSSK